MIRSSEKASPRRGAGLRNRHSRSSPPGPAAFAVHRAPSIDGPIESEDDVSLLQLRSPRSCASGSGARRFRHCRRRRRRRSGRARRAPARLGRGRGGCSRETGGECTCCVPCLLLLLLLFAPGHMRLELAPTLLAIASLVALSESPRRQCVNQPRQHCQSDQQCDCWCPFPQPVLWFVVEWLVHRVAVSVTT